MNSDQKNIVQVCLEYVPSAGGSISTILDINSVFKTKIIAFTSVINLVQDEKWDENVIRVPVSRGPLGKFYSFSFYSRTLRKAETVLKQADLIIIHELYRHHFQWASSIAREAEIPYWIIPHGQLDPYLFTYRSIQKKIWLSLVGCPVLKTARAVVFATEREYQKSIPYSKDSIAKIIHWPVKEIDTSSRLTVRKRIRALYGIPEDARVLFWIGRLHHSKRLIQTIKAFSMIDNENIHLMIVGPDGNITRQECEAYCKSNHIKNVHIIGPVYGDEKYAYFMSSDAYISLSLKENFNYTAAEAMASGLPVILSPGNDLSYELKSAKCGWMLSTLDTTECINALTQFAASSQNMLEEMGSSGQSWAREYLTKEVFSKAILKLASESLV